MKISAAFPGEGSPVSQVREHSMAGERIRQGFLAESWNGQRMKQADPAQCWHFIDHNTLNHLCFP